jgi:hypothetical protein
MDLELDSYYKHSQMSDGHLNICKSCVKNRVRKFYDKKIQDPSFLAAERKRTRERNIRLGYAEKYKAKTKEQKTRINEIKKRWDLANPEKRNAHIKLRRALLSGLLKKQPCAVCGSTKFIHAHHEDYSKPLEVIWLCSKHHRQVHWKD